VQTFAPPGFGARLDRFYDVSVDDERFLMTRSLGGTGDAESTQGLTILVQNFVEELKRLVPN